MTPSCSKTDFPSTSEEDGGQIKASLEKGNSVYVICNLAVAESPTVCAPTATVTHGCDGEAKVGLQGMAQEECETFSGILLFEAVWGQ